MIQGLRFKKGKKKTDQFRRQFDPHYLGEMGEANMLPSKTQPDMALTPKELLRNHVRGIHSDVKHYQQEFFEDVVIPNFDDITDEIEWKRNLKARWDEAQEAAKKEAAENAAKRMGENKPDTDTNEDKPEEKPEDKPKPSQKDSEPPQ